MKKLCGQKGECICEFEKYSDMKLCGNPLSQHNMTVNSDTSDLRGLKFTYDVQRQKTLNKLTKETVHKMSLYDYDLCSFGLKYNQGINCSWFIWRLPPAWFHTLPRNSNKMNISLPFCTVKLTFLQLEFLNSKLSF